MRDALPALPLGVGAHRLFRSGFLGVGLAVRREPVLDLPVDLAVEHLDVMVLEPAEVRGERLKQEALRLPTRAALPR